MTDPLSMMGSASGLGAAGARPAGVSAPGASLSSTAAADTAAGSGRVFEQEFLAEVTRQIDEVNRLQGDADMAAQDLVTGRRTDVEGVMIATQKADTAFRMLLAVRNRMMEAYEEVKQIRI